MAEQKKIYISDKTGAQLDTAIGKALNIEETLSGTAGTIPSSKAVKDAIDEVNELITEGVTIAQQDEIILPSNVYLLKSKDYSIYKTNILNGVDNRGDIDLYATGLKNYDKQFIANITNDASVPINGYDNVNNRTLLKTLELKAYDNTGITGKTLRVLCIGDSFTDIGQWVNEIYQQLDAAGATGYYKAELR